MIMPKSFLAALIEKIRNWLREQKRSANCRRRAIGLFERLEVRLPLDAASWQNPLFNLDVNDDGRISPTDALLVINELNNRENPTLIATNQSVTTPTSIQW